MATKFRWQIAQSAERKWWQRYLKNKNIEQYLAWKKNYWANLLQTCQAYILVHPMNKVLDAGCGPAGIFINFTHCQTTAIDPLLDSYQTDLPHFKKEMYPTVHFENVGIENFAAKQLFDVVFCMNAINHVQDIHKGYDVLCQSLEKNGKIIISIDAHNHTFFRKLFSFLPGDVLHPHQYNLAEYESFLTSRGLKILTTIELKREFFFTHYVQIAEKI
jgi:2-polyprenyl-3-methyl-5-hydroxy-6-metoxy-1,4-benzoquinol methylase